MPFNKLFGRTSDKDKLIYGICTDTYSLSDLDIARQEIYNEAKKQFDEVLLIDTRACTYAFWRGSDTPVVIHHGRDIVNISALHIRGRRERESSTAILARTLAYMGCHISDPVKQLPIGKATKLIGTLARFKKGIGADSFLGYDYTNTMEMLETIDPSFFPADRKTH